MGFSAHWIGAYFESINPGAVGVCSFVQEGQLTALRDFRIHEIVHIVLSDQLSVLLIC
jgi:hypothetical protein